MLQCRDVPLQLQLRPDPHADRRQIVGLVAYIPLQIWQRLCGPIQSHKGNRICILRPRIIRKHLVQLCMMLLHHRQRRRIATLSGIQHLTHGIAHRFCSSCNRRQNQKHNQYANLSQHH